MTWTLIEWIHAIISIRHIGREKAIYREDLLKHLLRLDVIDKITESWDRKVRKAIENNPEICSCEDGYFYDGGPEDVEYSIQYLMKKIMPLFKKIKERKLAYPEYYPDPDQLKLEL